MAIPGIPTGFQVQQGNAEVLFSWNLVAGATTYSVQRSTDGVSYAVVDTPSTNSFLDSTVTANTQYFYKVAAVNADGTSSYTGAQSVVPTFSGELSLGQVRLMSRQRADRVNSKFVTDPEWNTYIVQSYFELYDLLVTLYEDYFLAEPLMITTDGVSGTFPLPNGLNYNGARPFYKIMGVDMGLNNGGNAWVTLKKFEFISRNRYVFPNVSSTYLGVFNARYRVMGTELHMIPTPSGGQFLRLWYIPRLTQPLLDTDVLDGVSGWTEYVIVDAAIKALQKEESDVSVLYAQKVALRARIEESGMNRDAGQPDCISNTRTGSERWGGFGGPGFDGSFGGY